MTSRGQPGSASGSHPGAVKLWTSYINMLYYILIRLTKFLPQGGPVHQTQCQCGGNLEKPRFPISALTKYWSGKKVSKLFAAIYIF